MDSGTSPIIIKKEEGNSPWEEAIIYKNLEEQHVKTAITADVFIIDKTHVENFVTTDVVVTPEIVVNPLYLD